MASVPRFPAEGLKFLTALKRNNRREWFQAHRDDYERFVRAPMAEFVLALARDLPAEFVTDPKVCLYRIYRDTRFSKDKSPYKTHTAAVFPRRGLPKHSGAGLYFHIAPDGVFAGGGIYAPSPPELQLVRAHVAERFLALRTIVESPEFRKTFGTLHGEKLSRVPRGFPADHRAAEFLKHKQYLAGCSFTTSLAASARFYPKLLDCFRKTIPLIRFLNQPLVKRKTSSTDVTDHRMSLAR
jgi:uncharacterized protein (TIGR02453 family)